MKCNVPRHLIWGQNCKLRTGSVFKLQSSLWTNLESFWGLQIQLKIFIIFCSKTTRGDPNVSVHCPLCFYSRGFNNCIISINCFCIYNKKRKIYSLSLSLSFSFLQSIYHKYNQVRLVSNSHMSSHESHTKFWVVRKSEKFSDCLKVAQWLHHFLGPTTVGSEGFGSHKSLIRKQSQGNGLIRAVLDRTKPGMSY